MFQKDLVVWKPRARTISAFVSNIVSEGLSSVETVVNLLQ
mgnify:CR=1 FL=1